ITQVKETLTARGLGFAAKIPTVNATFPLFEAPNLAKAQQGYRLITTLRWLLPFLALALLAAGIWVARRHRRALIGAALGLSASMLVLAAALLIARAIYLNSVPQSVLPADAGRAHQTCGGVRHRLGARPRRAGRAADRPGRHLGGRAQDAAARRRG